MKKLCPKCGKIVDRYNHQCKTFVPAYIKAEQLEKRRKQAKEKRERRKRIRKYFDTLQKETESKSTKELRTRRWHFFREQVILRDGGECQRCLALHGEHVYYPLEVHHIKPRKTHPELMYDPDNVVTICKSCNAHLALNGIDFDFKPRNFEDYD